MTSEERVKVVNDIDDILGDWTNSGDDFYLQQAMAAIRAAIEKEAEFGMKKQKVTLTALKHELDCTTAATYTGRYEGALAIYRCEKCGGTFENFGQSYCCWCGRKIVE